MAVMAKEKISLKKGQERQKEKRKKEKECQNKDGQIEEESLTWIIH
jgi:hypothetical protein